MPEQPNVFILSVDSLPYSSFVEASERIASQINGTYFEQAIAPGSFTSSSMPAIATGKLTDQIPAWGLPSSGAPKPIAEELSNLDYNCGLWTDNYLFGSTYNYDRGFSAGNLGRPSLKKRMVNAIRETPLNRMFGVFESAYFNLVEPLVSMSGDESSFYRHASQLNDSTFEWLSSREMGTPAFCWIHYMDTHHPYQPPTEYLDNQSFNTHRTRGELGEFTRNAIKSDGDELSEADLEDLRTAYDACCRYIADELVEFIEQLRYSGHYAPEKDILILTADHGELLDPSRHGMLGHVPPAFWEDIIKVPLIIGHPHWSENVISDQVSLLDIKKVILDAVRTESEFLSPSDLGRDIAPFVSEWEELDDDSITTYRGVRRDDGHKLFGAKIDEDDRIIGTKVLNNMDDEVLSNVQYNSSDRYPSAWKRELVAELTQYGDPVEPNSDPGAIREQVSKQHLKDLGYVE